MRFNAFYSKSLPACLLVLYSYAWLATLLLALPTCKRSVTYPTTPGWLQPRFVSPTAPFILPPVKRAIRLHFKLMDLPRRRKKWNPRKRRQRERAERLNEFVYADVRLLSQIYVSELDNFIQPPRLRIFRPSNIDARFMIHETSDTLWFRNIILERWYFFDFSRNCILTV